MRTVVWLMLLAVAAAVAAAVLGKNDAMVTLFWAPWRVDLSFNLVLVGLLLAMLGLYAALRGLDVLVGLPRRAREWRIAKRERSAQQALREAMVLYFGARYSRAHKAALRALTIRRETPELPADDDLEVLAHTVAAGSMHRLQDRARRDEHLAQALAGASGNAAQRAAEEGARLLAVEWAVEDRDAERALELMAGLAPGAARRTHALRLKLQATRLAERPVEALKVARLLAKHQAFTPLAAQGLLRSLAIKALDAARDADQLRRVWQQFELADRRDAFVAARAARALVAFGEAAEARALLKPFWDDMAECQADERAELAVALAEAIAGIGSDWLPRLEAAVAAQPRDALLAHVLGLALVELQLWGKARTQLERCADDASLPARQRRQAWLTLAEMAEREGDEARANACYRKAARIA